MTNLTKIEKEALALFEKKIREAMPEQNIELRLFGSKARGEASKFSDVDVLVIMNSRDLSIRQQLYRMATDVFLETDVDLSVKIITPSIVKSLREKGSPLMINIDKEGVLL